MKCHTGIPAVFIYLLLNASKIDFIFFPVFVSAIRIIWIRDLYFIFLVYVLKTICLFKYKIYTLVFNRTGEKCNIK